MLRLSGGGRGLVKPVGFSDCIFILPIQRPGYRQAATLRSWSLVFNATMSTDATPPPGKRGIVVRRFTTNRLIVRETGFYE